MPGIADKFTQSAQGRLLWPGMTKIGKQIACTHASPHLRVISVVPSIMASNTGEASTAWT
jgi:hypothetical protein